MEVLLKDDRVHTLFHILPSAKSHGQHAVRGVRNEEEGWRD